MAQGQRTPGPILLFALPRNQGTASFLGTCVTAPKVEFEKFKIPVMNDLAGRSVPFQLIQDGELAVVYATLNRFDYALIQALRALENGNPSGFSPAGNNTVGVETGVARGTLNIGISDWQLVMVNSYFGTPAAGAFSGTPDLIPGRQFRSCNIRKYDENTEGTRVLEVSLAIDCQNVFFPNQNLTFRGFELYTENPASASPTAPFS